MTTISPGRRTAACCARVSTIFVLGAALLLTAAGRAPAQLPPQLFQGILDALRNQPQQAPPQQPPYQQPQQPYQQPSFQPPGAIPQAPLRSPDGDAPRYTIDFIRALQARLATLGYQPGDTNGTYTAETREALRRFQQRHGLPVDGLPRPSTYAVLSSTGAQPATASGAQGYPAAPLTERPEHDRALVREIQGRLAALGYQPGPIDGVHGRATAAAIHAFQRQSGLSPDGEPSPALLQQLRRAEASRPPSGPMAPPMAGAPQLPGQGQFPGHGAPVQGGTQWGAWGSGTYAPPPPLTSGSVSGAPSASSAGASNAPGPGMAAAPAMVPGALAPPAAAPVAPRPGVASVVPVRMGDFLLAQHPFNDRAVSAFFSFLDLAILRQWPDVANNSCVAHGYARTFMIGELKDRYTNPERPECVPSFSTLTSWRGANEFEQRESHRRFVAEQVPHLRELGAGTPFHIVRIIPTDLGAYNEAAQQFPIDVRGGMELYLGDRLLVRKFALHTRGGRLPETVPMQPAAARTLVERMGNRRQVFVAVYMTVEQPTWDYVSDAPRMTVRHIHTRLYVDPEARELVHDFGPVGGSAPAAAAATPAAPTVVARIHDPAIIFKLAPSFFTDEELTRRAQKQIEAEQQWLQGRGYREGPAMFRREEIAGRMANFAAQQLLPEYKQRLTAAVAAVPRQMTFDYTIGLGEMAYVQGALRQLSHDRRPLNPPRLAAISVETDSDRKEFAALGQRDAIRLQQLSAAQPPAGMPMSIREGNVVGFLALDRTPFLPPLPLDARLAEQQWQAPSCSTHLRFHTDRGMTAQAAREAAADCERRQKAFSDGRFRIAFEIELEDGVMRHQRQFYVKAKLIGAKVYGTQGDLLHSFPASVFPPAVDVAVGYETGRQRREREQREAEAQRASQEQARARQQADTLANREAELANADIVGIKIGMSVVEAEKIVRASMQVRWVVAIIKEQNRHTTTEIRPYRDGRTFISSDGNEFIALYVDPSGEQVVGVGRSLFTKADQQTLINELVKKYGEPTTDRSSQPKWYVTAEQQRTCSVHVSGHATLNNVDILEGPGAGQRGEAGLSQVAGQLPVFEVYAGRDHTVARWDTSKWLACGPGVAANIFSDNRGYNVFSYAIFNLKAYAAVYRPPASAPPPRL